MGKTDGLKGRSRKMYSKQFHDLYSSTKVIRVINLRNTTYARLVAGVGTKRNASTITGGKKNHT